MKKVLLVGKFTDQFREINKKLSQTYEVRACVNKLEIFKGMFKLNKPDVVVMLFGEMNETNESLLRDMEKEHSEIPVVCAGIHKEAEKSLADLLLSRAVFLAPPYSAQELMEKVDYALNENFVEDLLIKTLGIDLDLPEDDEVFVRKEEKKESLPEQKSKSLGSSKKSILIVDDSGMYLRMLNSLLAEKYEVRLATSGIKALTMIREKRPDLILLDYEMPIIDGRETMLKIRESEENRDIPIVFVTAVNKIENIKSVLELRPAGYLLKPINKDKLYQSIKEVIG